VTDDVVWRDPALAEPARGPGGVADFVRQSARAFPDMRFEERGDPAIAEGGRVAYAPWVMTATNTGPIDPPGFAPTGKRVEIRGIDVWRFREGLIWRYEASYDFAEVARQLGLMPPRGGFAEKAMVRTQRLRSMLPG
jgi:predicted ester cyclase